MTRPRPAGRQRVGRVRVTAVAGLLAAALPAAGEVQRYPTPEETRAEFAAVCRRFTEGDNPYFGAAMIPQLERRLEAAAGDPLAEMLLEGRLAHELIRLGRLEEASRHLEAGIAVARTQGREEGRSLEQRLIWYQALAHLLLAEDANCVAANSGASCILPFREAAIHRDPRHARAAGDLLLRYLSRDAGNVQARWLLNLARMVTGDYPDKVPPEFRLPAAALVSEAPFPLWRNLAPELGVDAFDLSGGAVMDDFDGDGLLDLVSSAWDPCEPMKAFRNDGRGGFEDVASSWGLGDQLGGLNLAHADFDGDGDLDLLVLRGAWLGEEGQVRNSLLRNDLDRPAARFVDVTAAAGLAYPAYPTQTAAWADYDGDGDLDLYVGNEATAQSVDPLTLTAKSGEAYPAQLFRNQGDGTFVDVARAAGVTNHRFAKGVAWGDYDDDGDPDLYISNIGPNRLYRNEGDGTFVDVAPELGVHEPAAITFPTWFFDYDNDGDLDLLVASFSAPARVVSASYLGLPLPPGGRPVLYRNDGGRFADVSAEAGLTRPLLIMGANYGDFDNDGFPDLYFGTGVPDFDSLMPNVAYRNDGGRRFVDVTFAGGLGHLQKGHGVAFGDLDNDGDQDLFEQLGGAYPYDKFGNALYENPGAENAWLVLRLRGRGMNRFAVGARIEVRVREGDSRRSVHALVGSGGSFGCSSLQQELGLGRADAIEAVVVRWPGGGAAQVFTAVDRNRFYEAVQGEPELRPFAPPRLHLGAGGPPPAHDHRHRGQTP